MSGLTNDLNTDLTTTKLLHPPPGSSRSQLSSPCQIYSEDDEFDLYPPSGKRLAPVGAASNEDEDMNFNGASTLQNPMSMTASNGLGLCERPMPASDGGLESAVLEEKLRQMEEDQEELNTSLMSLTSHFAKVSGYRQNTALTLTYVYFIVSSVF